MRASLAELNSDFTVWCTYQAALLWDQRIVRHLSGNNQRTDILVACHRSVREWKELLDQLGCGREYQASIANILFSKYRLSLDLTQRSGHYWNCSSIQAMHVRNPFRLAAMTNVRVL